MFQEAKAGMMLFKGRNKGQSIATISGASVLALMLSATTAVASPASASSPGAHHSAASRGPSADVGSSASLPKVGKSAASQLSRRCPPVSLVDKTWNLTAAFPSLIDLAKYNINIEFTTDKISGFSGVNWYNASYATGKNRSITFGPLTTTKRGGTPEATAAEQAYLSALRASSRYATIRYGVGKATLILFNPDDLFGPTLFFTTTVERCHAGGGQEP